MKKFLYALVTLVFLPTSIFAQGTYVPLGGDTYHYIDRLDIKYGRVLPGIHTTIKPYLRSEVGDMAEALTFSNLKLTKRNKFQLQYLLNEAPEWLDSATSKTERPLFRALYKEPASFFSVYSKNKGAYDFHVNPIIALQLGGESYKNRFIFNQQLGLEFRFNLKKVLSAYVLATGSSERNPGYANELSFPATNRIYTFVPGNAYYKVYNSKIFKFNDGLDFFDARGYVNVNVLDYLNITFGRDKHFWGNGQRSLFHSDFAAPTLFLKYKLSFWRIQYTYLLEQLTSQYIRGTDVLLPKKYGVFHHLNIKCTRWFDFGLFEGVMAKRGNYFDIQYLNPIVFYRAVEHAIGSPDNVLIGLDFKANAFNHLSVYGQFILDEFNFKEITSTKGWWANKYGFQLGAKYIDLLPNFDLQAEVNYVRPFTYTHGGEINFTHYNQPLAHPLGANFYEFILQAKYQPIPRLFVDMKFISARTGDDTLLANSNTYSNYGGNIFRTDGPTMQYGNSMAQGGKAISNYLNINAAYQAWHNIYIDLGLTYRNRDSKAANMSNNTFFVMVGARMNIVQRKFEF